VITRLVDSRQFALADLACAAICGLWWYVEPGIGGWPLLIVLAPWAMRLASGHFPFKRSAFDLFVAVFLLTALIGVWAAYDRGIAWSKLWVIVAGIFVYYALAGQPAANLWLIANLLSLMAAVIAAYFLLTYDWRAFPTDFAVLDRVGVWWMSFRPSIQGFLHPNIAGGLLATLIAFPLASGIRAWQRSRRWLMLSNGLLVGLVLIALTMTSSRGAWGALAIVLGAWGVWELGRFVARHLGWPSRLVSGLLLLLAIGAGLLVILTHSGGVVALAGGVPGAPDAESRYELAYNTLRLVADFPFTGGGLGAFSGLYSRYMLIIFVPLFTYSHNLFLDVALEQGLFGLLALVGMIVGSLLLVVKRFTAYDQTLLRWAISTSLLTVILHGFIDDALYGNRGTPLLLALMGLSVAVAGNAQATDRRASNAFEQSLWRHRGLAGLAGVMGVAGLLYFIGPRLASAWFANLGAVQMARIELADWPESRWDRPMPQNALGQAQMFFEQALRFDPANRAAHYRLGLIASRYEDYPQAVAELEKAYQVDFGHRGVIKALGYGYVWLGQSERARDLLATIPEATDEMGTYAWWWKTQGRPDRAGQAAQMVSLLQLSSSKNN
jgi:tetratricopeptide (TPR) repeat protein